MKVFELSKPFWARKLRNPIGILSVLAMPILVLAIWKYWGGPASRWESLLLMGWTVSCMLPAALNGRRDDNVEARWRSMPVGAGDRWLGAFLAMFPLALVTAEMLALVGMAYGPHAEHTPYLLTLSALVAAVMVAFGLAIGAWSRSSWALAGILAVVFHLSVWALLPGVGGWPAEVIPTGQAHLALSALGKDPITLLIAMVKLSLVGGVLVIIGIVGIGRK